MPLGQCDRREDTVPISAPAATAWPACTVADTGSYVVRSPSGCTMLTAPTPATGPANAIVPRPAAKTGSVTTAERSTPRCPGNHGSAGGSNKRTTLGVPASGH
jgi:hypothetical protein